MGILGRLSTMIKSNVNDLIDSMQDPAKEIDQMVLDMEKAVRDARGEVAACIAEEKRLGKRLGGIEDEARSWEERAAMAVRGGDDALARESLRRKAEKEAERVEVEKALGDQKVYVDQLTAGLKALEARVKDVKLRQGTLREKARMAKKGDRATLSSRTSAFDDFERMASKIDEVEVAASLDEELGARGPGAAEADRKLRDLAEGSSVDDALAELKKKLDK